MSFFLAPVYAEIIRVGPQEEVRTLAGAAARAQNGDTVEIAAGDYYRDVAAWNQNDLTLRAVGGKVRLIAAGASAEGKAIWVLRGRNVVVDGIEFQDAKVADRNGAGIRLEAGSATVRNCRFIHNQNGILTSSRSDIALTVENSEFAENGYGDGQSHNLYVGAIARLHVTGSYFHHAKVGHLLKSRARINYIAYNRLTDETGGRASYELEFPNGGQAYVIGNIIEQSSTTENFKMISYGMEGYSYPGNSLYLIHNTLVDDRPTPGFYLDMKTGGPTVTALNNILVGGARWVLPSGSVDQGNVEAQWEDLAMPVRMDYRLSAHAQWLNKVAPIPKLPDIALAPVAQYRFPHETIKLKGPAQHPGALQDVVR